MIEFGNKTELCKGNDITLIISEWSSAISLDTPKECPNIPRCKTSIYHANYEPSNIGIYIKSLTLMISSVVEIKCSDLHMLRSSLTDQMQSRHFLVMYSDFPGNLLIYNFTLQLSNWSEERFS